MKKIISIAIFIFPFLAFHLISDTEKLNQILQKKDANFYEIQKVMNEEFDANNPSVRRGWKQFKRWEYFWQQRVYPTGTFPNSIDIYNETNTWNKKIVSNKIQEQKIWKNLGPDEPPSSKNAREQGVGRINIIRFHPNDELDLWVGAASGGLWRSTNGGNTWTGYPYFNFLSLGVTDIAISPSNPNIIYVTTGDADGSIGSANNYYSIGVVKSTDGGVTWNTTGYAKELADKRILTRILVNPKNSDIVILAAADGIRKSMDGGKTWTVKTTEWSVIDLEFKPDDSNVIWGSTYSHNGKNYVIKSTDGGETWKASHLVSGSFRLNIEVTKYNPEEIFCLASSSSTNGFHSVVVSNDMGANWETTASLSTVGNLLGWYDGKESDQKGQGGYDLGFAVSPNDENMLFVGGVNIWKSSDMGASFILNTHWFGYYSKPFVHADIHDLRFSPSGKRLYACHDGGISYTANGGVDWNDISKGLNITQFYRMSSTDLYPNVIMGGSQDNGTSAIIDGEWTHVYSGDGMECLVDPQNPLRMFASLYYGSFFRTNNGGLNFSNSISKNTTSENAGWVTPFVCNPQNSNTLFCGHQNVWRNQSSGDASRWKKLSNFGSSQVLQSLAVAPSDSNTIYAANLSEIFVTYDSGANWKSILSSNATAITYIAVDPTNPKRIWITKSGYSASDKVWTYDGTTWTNLSGNLPNVPTNTIVYQKNSPSRIYIGTDIGVYFSDYNSGYWERFGDQLPNVIVLELEISYSSKVMLRAATYGRGIWECEVLDCNLPEPQVNIIGDTEFCEGKNVKLELNGNYTNFAWSTGETTKSITISKSGTYSVIVTNTDGCKAKSQGIVVKVNPNKELTINSSTGYFAFCGNQDTIELRASLGFEKYSWSNGDSTRRIVITQTGEYFVTGTTSSGCVTKSITLNIQKGEFPAKPTVSQTGRTLESTDATAYQWYKDGKKITDAKSKTYTLKEDDLGKFMVEVFNEIGCSTFSDEFDLVGVNDEFMSDNLGFEISPNPNHGEFTLNLNNFPTGLLTVDIIDLTGKSIYNHTFESNGFNSMNIKLNASSGEYILRLITKDKIHSKKLIKN